MKVNSFIFFLPVILVLMTGCFSADQNRTQSVSRTDMNVISSQLIAEHGFSNAYEAVQRLNSRWLRTRGVDSFRSPTQVVVYMDNTRLGGVATLRGISAFDIGFIRYFPPEEATARYGFDHGQGVIYVSTRPE